MGVKKTVSGEVETSLVTLRNRWTVSGGGEPSRGTKDTPRGSRGTRTVKDEGKPSWCPYRHTRTLTSGGDAVWVTLRSRGTVSGGGESFGLPQETLEPDVGWQHLKEVIWLWPPPPTQGFGDSRHDKFYCSAKAIFKNSIKAIKFCEHVAIILCVPKSLLPLLFQIIKKSCIEILAAEPSSVCAGGG